MFNGLRLKLTLLNSAIIGLILLSIIFLLYFEFPEIAYIHSVDDRGKYFNTITVRVDNSGDIVYRSTNLSISDADLRSLVKMVSEHTKHSGNLRLKNSESYFFIRLITGKDNEMTIVFFDSKARHSLTHHFLTESVFIALFAVVLVFIGSLFMSSRSLIPIKKSWQKQIDFTADASHELRTPLAVVRTNLELIMGNPDETVGSQKKWLENILIENNRMAKLVDDLLTLSRADSCHQSLEISTFMLDEAILEAIAPFEPVAASKQISLGIHLSPETEFSGDRNRLKQLIIILLDNALKYSDNSGKIDIHLRKRDKEIEITVSDTGEGIAKEHLEKIFDRFYRVDKARARHKGSSGLGLAIAKWIIDEHHGLIKVDSTPGKGTRFVVSIPNNRCKSS
ncbi:MAG: HAMP domain-containing histidine kinase [Clostridia bacterium]|nr:HAMP domain-containing histidine kinase [Clostridia bacterium]